MLDIRELCDYIHNDCTIDLYDIIKGEYIKRNLTHQKAIQWHEKHNYEISTIEPSHENSVGEQTFGIMIAIELK